MKKWQLFFIISGRIFIGLLFILSAINKVINWQETERGLSDLLCDWQSYVSFSISLQYFFTTLLQWVPTVLLVITIAELFGGLLVFFGVKVRIGAILLILFLIPTTVLFHHFWFLAGMKREMHMIQFFKNIAILGSLFYILACGDRGDFSSSSDSFKA